MMSGLFLGASLVLIFLPLMNFIGQLNSTFTSLPLSRRTRLDLRPSVSSISRRLPLCCCDCSRCQHCLPFISWGHFPSFVSNSSRFPLRRFELRPDPVFNLFRFPQRKAALRGPQPSIRRSRSRTRLSRPDAHTSPSHPIWTQIEGSEPERWTLIRLCCLHLYLHFSILHSAFFFFLNNDVPRPSLTFLTPSREKKKQSPTRARPLPSSATLEISTDLLSATHTTRSTNHPKSRKLT